MTDDSTPPGPQKATKMLPKDPNFEVRQMGSWRGHDGSHSVIHGLYRKELTAEEAPIAAALVEDWRNRYGLDEGVDLAQVYEAVVAFIKSRRDAPNEAADHNQRDAKLVYSRLFKEHLESLGINRKNRRGDGDGNAALDLIRGLTKKESPKVVETEQGEDGVHRPVEGAGE